MKRTILILITGLPLLCTWGCSMPKSARYAQIESISRQEKSIKSGFTRKKVVIIQDFRENDRFDEDIEQLKAKVEAYITEHPELSDAQKANLRELKVTEGAGAEEIRLLLGKPDKITDRKSLEGISSETWIYRINHRSTFTVFIFPVLPMHEGYYLKLENKRLKTIERHFLEQVLDSGGGGYTGKEKP